VPIGALLDTGNGPGVWLIDGEPAKVSWRPVSVQQLDEERARITGTIKAGERIVALGANLLRDGERVRVSPETPVVAAKELP
jgi:multidrug efflux pump subunit AcrA (membrane-fusion protein)